MDTAKGGATNGALKWNRKKAWGSVGMTYYVEVEVGDDVWGFVIDQPRRGEWVARGWVNGEHTYYRDGQHSRTLAGMKQLVADFVGRLVKAAGL